jgi:hypothetical protein
VRWQVEPQRRAQATILLDYEDCRFVRATS